MGQPRLLILVALILNASACYGATQAPVWDRGALPESLRPLIHLTSAQLPPFTVQDSTLLHPLEWPDSMAFLGRQYHLEVATQEGDLSTFGSKRAIRPGSAVDLDYSYQWKKPKHGVPVFLFAGPAFSWNKFGRLYRRAWTRPDTVTYHEESYTTYPSGTLFLYELYEREADVRFSRYFLEFIECFDGDGSLLGVTYRRSDQKEQRWWEGQPASESEWDESVKQLARVIYMEEKEKRR